MGTKETQWSIGSNIDFFNLRLELSFFIISGAAVKQKIQRDILDLRWGLSCSLFNLILSLFLDRQKGMLLH